MSDNRFCARATCTGSCAHTVCVVLREAPPRKSSLHFVFLDPPAAAQVERFYIDCMSHTYLTHLRSYVSNLGRVLVWCAFALPDGHQWCACLALHLTQAEGPGKGDLLAVAEGAKKCLHRALNVVLPKPMSWVLSPQPSSASRPRLGPSRSSSGAAASCSHKLLPR